MKKLLYLPLFLVLVVPSVTLAAFSHDLIYGKSGSDVSELQRFLTREGMYHGPVNGSFGPLTKSAVVAFQKHENIVPHNGTFGPATRKRANAILDTHSDWTATLSGGGHNRNADDISTASPGLPSQVIQQTTKNALAGVTEADLDAKIEQLRNELFSKISQVSTQSQANYAANSNAIALTNKIDTLTNTVITTPSITGGSVSNTAISGGTISGATLSGTTLSNITSSGGSLSGGTISGATLSGTTTNSGTINGGTVVPTTLTIPLAAYNNIASLSTFTPAPTDYILCNQGGVAGKCTTSAVVNATTPNINLSTTNYASAASTTGINSIVTNTGSGGANGLLGFGVTAGAVVNGSAPTGTAWGAGFSVDTQTSGTPLNEETALFAVTQSEAAERLWGDGHQRAGAGECPRQFADGGERFRQPIYRDGRNQRE